MKTSIQLGTAIVLFASALSLWAADSYLMRLRNNSSEPVVVETKRVHADATCANPDATSQHSVPAGASTDLACEKGDAKVGYCFKATGSTQETGWIKLDCADRPSAGVLSLELFGR